MYSIINRYIAQELYISQTGSSYAFSLWLSLTLIRNVQISLRTVKCHGLQFTWRDIFLPNRFTASCAPSAANKVLVPPQIGANRPWTVPPGHNKAFTASVRIKEAILLHATARALLWIRAWFTALALTIKPFVLSQVLQQFRLWDGVNQDSAGSYSSCMQLLV